MSYPSQSWVETVEVTETQDISDRSRERTTRVVRNSLYHVLWALDPFQHADGMPAEEATVPAPIVPTPDELVLLRALRRAEQLRAAQAAEHRAVLLRIEDIWLRHSWDAVQRAGGGPWTHDVARTFLRSEPWAFHAAQEEACGVSPITPSMAEYARAMDGLSVIARTFPSLAAIAQRDGDG